MTYFILLDNDDQNTMLSLGTISFNKFWPEQGFEALLKMINEFPDLLYKIKIYDETKKKYSIESFLKLIEKLHIAKI